MFILIAPETSEAGGGTQLPPPGALPARNFQRLVETSLSRSRATLRAAEQYFSSHPMQFCRPPVRAALLDTFQYRIDMLERLTRMTAFAQRGSKRRVERIGPRSNKALPGLAGVAH